MRPQNHSCLHHSDLRDDRGVVRSRIRSSFIRLPVLHVGSPTFRFHEVSRLSIGALLVPILGYRRSETLKTLFMFTINRAILMSIIQIGLLSSYLSGRHYLYW